MQPSRRGSRTQEPTAGDQRSPLRRGTRVAGRFMKRPYGRGRTSARDGGRGKPLPYGGGRASACYTSPLQGEVSPGGSRKPGDGGVVPYSAGEGRPYGGGRGLGAERRAAEGVGPYSAGRTSPRIGGRSPVAPSIARRTPRRTTPGNARRYGAFARPGKAFFNHPRRGYHNYSLFIFHYSLKTAHGISPAGCFFSCLRFRRPAYS